MTKQRGGNIVSSVLLHSKSQSPIPAGSPKLTEHPANPWICPPVLDSTSTLDFRNLSEYQTAQLHRFKTTHHDIPLPRPTLHPLRQLRQSPLAIPVSLTTTRHQRKPPSVRIRLPHTTQHLHQPLRLHQRKQPSAPRPLLHRLPQLHPLRRKRHTP